jgi:hypothetical protein
MAEIRTIEDVRKVFENVAVSLNNWAPSERLSKAIEGMAAIAQQYQPIYDQPKLKIVKYRIRSKRK